MPSGNTPSLDSFSPATSQRPLVGIKYFLLLWPLFFAICFGLGYPTLRRYDPRTVEGMSDTPKYHAMTTGADTSSFREIFRCRVLVPYVARPFYWFARDYLGSWDPGFFGLLMANALFCATTACIVVSIGQRLLKDLSIALLGATLYLLSFAIPNLQLAGLVDAGEACFLAALVWSLLTRRWYLLPLWGVLGALAKETFAPFSVVFAFTWWLTERREDRLQRRTLKLSGERLSSKNSELMWIAALGFIGMAVVVVVHSSVAGHFRWPWEIANDSNAEANYVAALWRSFSDRSFWYVFGWLIPFGVWRLKDFPRPWLVASITSSIVALMLVMFINAGGNVARPIFNIVGPLLSLSVALLIARPSGHFAPAKA